jgi:RimJ/RimL family protein N-acetyltransferase
MTFSETARLRIRGYRESDLDKLVTLFSDARTMRGSPMFVVPKSEMKHKSELPELFEKSPMGCILETKEPLEDGNEWVGMVLLMANGTPKNRDVHLGIALDARHWGKGYGICLRHQRSE